MRRFLAFCMMMAAGCVLMAQPVSQFVADYHPAVCTGDVPADFARYSAENAKKDSLARLDSLAAKDPSVKKNLTAADSAKVDKVLKDRKMRNIFGRRKNKAKSTDETAKTEDAQ